MTMTGKLIGALMGFLVFAPSGLAFLGLMIGCALGHLFDKGVAQDFGVGSSYDHEASQRVFFKTTFTVLGYLAKSDGRVSEAEIAVAERLMQRMRILGPARQQAISFFNEGKSAGFDIDPLLSRFVDICGRHSMLMRVFLEVQIQMVIADGTLNERELQVLRRIARVLRVSELELNQLVDAAVYAAGFSHRQQHNQSFQAPSKAEQLEQACAILGVKSTASEQEIKRAYKKLMAQHHPDKLLAKGLPEEMMEVAKEKTQEIQGAYDFIIKNRQP